MMIEYAVARMQSEMPLDLADFLAADVTLVPIPGSAPLLPNGLWVARRICEAMRAVGLGQSVLPCLQRVTAVPKSAYAARGARPSPQQHYDSMRVNPQLHRPMRITLIDDVVTLGATFIAAASLVKEEFPEAEVRAFALIRTRGLTPEIAQVVDPVVGEITLDVLGKADRNP